MKKMIEVDVCLDGKEVAEELWNWDAEKQANFLYNLGYLYKYNKPDFLYQMSAVADEINQNGGELNREVIVQILETLLTNIKEGEVKE